MPLTPAQKTKVTTPVKINNLEPLLANLDDQTANSIINGFKEGFRLGSNQTEFTNDTPQNHKSALRNSNIVTQKIEKEIKLGRYRGPFPKPPLENLIVSPLGLVPKKEIGKFRVIHDLSYPKSDSVNLHIPLECSTVSYQNIETVIHLVQKNKQGCLMAKADIEDAFRLIPIHQEDHHLLGFTWKNAFYYDTCLPMGCSSSCQIFESFSTSVQWILTNKYDVEDMAHLLDDFFFVGPSGSKKCQTALENFHKLCDHIGVPIKHEKTESPTTEITIFGFEINSNLMLARLPLDKVEKIKQLLSDLKTKKRVTLQELQSIIGLLNFACAVIIPGRAFLRRLINLTIGVKQPHHHISLNSEARADLAAWHTFIEKFNGKSCFLFNEWVSSDAIKLYTDAAGEHGGFAAVLGSQWFVGTWKPEMQQYHITVKELFPIILAIEIWGAKFKNHKLLFLTDNEAVACIINKTSSKDKTLMVLVRRLVVAALKFNIFFRAKHIPGKTNVVADQLSRFCFQRAREYAPWLDPNPVVIPEGIYKI